MLSNVQWLTPEGPDLLKVCVCRNVCRLDITRKQMQYWALQTAQNTRYDLQNLKLIGCFCILIMSLSKAGAHRHQFLLTVSAFLFLCHITLLCAAPSPSHSYSVVVWSERPHHCWYPIIQRPPPVLDAVFLQAFFSSSYSIY